ncbi:Sm-like protein lsm7, partial [Blomia tropicalis]
LENQSFNPSISDKFYKKFRKISNVGTFTESFIQLHLAHSSIGGDRSGGINLAEKKKKESIVDLSKYMDKAIRIKFQGGREATGILKGYDTLLNIVLDNTTEFLRDPDDPFKVTDDTRQLGLVVCRVDLSPLIGSVGVVAGDVGIAGIGNNV